MPSLSDSEVASVTTDPARLAALSAFNILDTPPEASFDRITRVAASLFDASMAFVNFIDANRQWSKACVGLDVDSLPLSQTFCVHTIEDAGPMIIEDASADPRFADNPIVAGEPGIRFYAGMPLETDEGERIGTICVLDTEPKSLPSEAIHRLQDLAGVVMDALKLRRALVERQEAHERLAHVKSAVEHATDAILLTDADGTPVYTNPAFEAAFGHTAQSLADQGGLSELADDPAGEEALKHAFDVSDGSSEIIHLRTRSGTRRVIDLRTSTVQSGAQPVGHLCVLADITGRIETQAALQEKQNLLQGILDTSVASIFVIGPDRSVRFMNDRAREVMGFPEGTMPSVETLIARSERPKGTVRPPIYAEVVNRRAAVFDRQYVWTRPGGEERRLSVNASPILDADGQVRQIVYSVEDVTERLRQQALRAGQSRILTLIAEGAALSDILARIVDLLERERPGVLGSILLLDPDARTLQHGAAPSLPEDFVSAIDGVEIGPQVGSCGTAAFENRPVITENIMADPKWEDYRDVAERNDLRACWSTPIRGSEGHVLGTFAFYHDEPRRPESLDQHLAAFASGLAAIAIEQARREERMQASEARYRLLAENVRDIVCMHAPDGTYRWISPSVEEVLGVPPEAMEGASPYDVVHPDDVHRLRDFHQVLLCGEEASTLTYRIRHADGSYVWLETLARPIFDEEGDVTQVQTSSRDVSGRVRRQRELVEAKQEAEQMNHLKTAFLANMSHEIRTPLTSIIGFAEILKQEAADEHQRMSSLIHRSGQRLMETLDSVLQLSRLEAGTAELNRVSVDVAADVAETVELLRPRATEEEVTLAVNVPDTEEMVQVDPGALHRILNNVIGNAIKFTEPGGSVHVRLLTGDDVVSIQVEDDGIGIEEAFLPQLFDAFKQEQSGASRGYEGSGLGLAVVQRLVHAHGGTVRVSSTKGEGSTFTISLPRT